MIETFVGHEDKPKTYGRGRRCATCHAFLSIYNSFDVCDPCKPQGRRIYPQGGRHRPLEVDDWQEITEGIDFGAMMEEAA